jgi:hypothetical protein
LLKDPLLFVSSLFVKKPSRIEGLLMVMTLALLVYSVTQRRRFCRKVAISSVLASVSHGISESRFSDFTPKIEICDRTR